MTKKNKKLINYTSRDFNNIKQSLVDYAKRYYPDNFKDFSEASFGSLMLDTVSYMGDVLSFYLDYQTNESFIDTAIEYDNILRLGEQVGYKEKLRANSFGIVSFYILAPVTAAGTPDTDYLPVLAKGSQVSSNAGQIFTLIDDVDFGNPNNEIVPAAATPGAGTVTSYAVKAYGRVMSGQEETQLINVGSFARFLTVELQDPNITEIVTVTDAEGHEYFEVEYLSQDTIFRSVVNKDDNTRQHVPNIMVATSVPRRFVTTKKNNIVTLKFGYGSESSLKTDTLSHPADVVLKMHGRNYEQDTSFDPSKLVESDKFGIAPANTTLKVVFRKNTSDNSNIATAGLTNLVSPVLIFNPAATNRSKISSVRDSLEVTNEQPITGDVSLPTTGELKQRVNDIFATQNRAVTANDYEALIYRMPAKFGQVKRAKIVRDQDSFKRNLNLYVVSEDNNQKLIPSSQILKNNLKTWLNNYRMINDTIDVLDPKIINIQIDFTAVVDYEQDKFEALNLALTEVQDMMEEKLDIGQPIYITKIYDVLNNLDEIVDVVNVKITNKTSGLYSSNSLVIEDYISADGRILYAPEDVIYEIKYPNLDIKGTIR